MVQRINNISNKKLVGSCFLIAILIMVISFAYAYWNMSFTQTGKTVSSYDCFDVKFVEEKDGVTLTNGYPLSDEAGLGTESYDVTITNVCNTITSYDVVLNKLDTSTLKDDYIKIAVNDDIELLSDTKTVKSNLANALEGKVILSGVLLENQSKTISIRNWMDIDTPEEEGTNKVLEYKITIEATAGESNLLASNILKNNIVNESPNYLIGEPPSSSSNTGSGLYKAEDNDGDSYYYRGAVSNNYVLFAGITWRIVRINGDGTIRIIMQDSSLKDIFNTAGDGHKYTGFTYDNESLCSLDNQCVTTFDVNSKTFTNNKNVTNSTIKSTLENWYISNLSDFDSHIALTNYCADTYYTVGGDWHTYGAFTRVSQGNPSFLCTNPNDTYGGSYKLKIGLLSLDEFNMAGYGYNEAANASNYLYITRSEWTMTPRYSSSTKSAVCTTKNGNANENYITSYTETYRPVINLNANVEISGGNGSSLKPYIIK